MLQAHTSDRNQQFQNTLVYVCLIKERSKICSVRRSDVERLICETDLIVPHQTDAGRQRPESQQKMERKESLLRRTVVN